MERREAQTLALAAILFYVLGLVALYFGGVVIAASLFCVGMFFNLGFVQSSCDSAVSESKHGLSERLTRMENELKVIRRILEEQTASSNR